MVLIVDYKVVRIGVAYDIQNQVLGSTSQLIKLLDVVGFQVWYMEKCIPRRCMGFLGL